MPHARFPLPLGHLDDLLREGGVDACHETVLLAAEVRVFAGKLRQV